MNRFAVNVASLARGLLIGLVILAPLPCLAAVPDTPDRPIEQWLQGAEHHDFAWKVQILGPWLSFQQRHVAGIRAVLPVHKLMHAGVSLSDLNFVVRVGDGGGHWLPGQIESRFDPPRDAENGKEIDFFARFYVRPGKYVVAVLAYDGRNRRRNLWKGGLQVPPLKPDPLPEASRNLPVLEFPNDANPASSDLGQAKLFLPVANTRPVQLDVVVNLALSDATNRRYTQAPDWVYRSNAGVLLQIGKVISQLDLREGCIRFSALDILRQKVFVDRVTGANTDWDQLTHSVESIQRNKIDVHVLEQQKMTPALFARFLEQVASDRGTCGVTGREPLHVLIVISDAFLFPTKAAMTVVRPEVASGTQCYYLQVNPIRGGAWDQIGHVIGPLHPRRWEFSSAERFRRVVAELVAEIENEPHLAKPGVHLP